MGGNVVINDIQADKIDLRLIDRESVCNDLYDSIITILYNFQTDLPKEIEHKFLFSKFNDYLSGSSKFLFSKLITTKELIRYKPVFGDVDFMVPKEIRKNLESFLTEKEGVTFGKLRLIGFKNSNSQLISLWYSTTFKIHIQIDFEFVDFENNKPSEWAVFSHGANWQDTKLEIKASMHKYLLQSVAGYHKEEMTVLTGKKLTPKQMIKSPRAFSVTHGYRQRFIQHNDGTWIELSTAESNNITDINQLFGMLFPLEVSQNRIDLMHSFTGVVILIKKFHTEIRKLIVDDFAQRLFGKNAQKTARDDKQQDYQVKITALEHLAGELFEWTGVQYRFHDLIEEYYSNY